MPRSVGLLQRFPAFVAVVIVVGACTRTVLPCVSDCVPIRSEEVVLAASIDLPDGPGPHPVMIAVHGSGKVERDQFESAGHFWNSQGMAYVRFDKRGVGQSEGEYRNVDAKNSSDVFEELAADVAAVVEHVAAMPEVDASRIGLIGSSQAGWIMPLVASRSAHVSFIISISGAASSVGLSDYFDEIAESDLTEAEIADKLARFEGHHGFDPRPALQSLQIPVLWLYGGRDQSNPTHNDIAIIEEIRTKQGSDFEIEFFPRGTHDLVDTDTGEPYDTFVRMVRWLEDHRIIER